MRTWLYGRQSHGSKTSIDQQFAEQIEDVTELGWTIAGKLSDGISASRFEARQRDDWPKLLSAIRAGKVDSLCLWEASRGDRKPATWFAFLDLCMEKGVLIRVTDNHRTYDLSVAEDYKTLGAAGLDARHESEKTSRRILRDVRDNAAKGRPGGRKLYGYERRYEIVNGKPRIVEVTEHPTQGPVVRGAFHRISNGVPLAVVAKDLNDRGITAPMGGSWTGTQIKKLIVNRAYLGLRIHKGTEYPAMWPALTDQATFDRANAIVSDPDRKSWEDASTKHLLTGIAMCGVCGGFLRVNKSRGVTYYQCGAKFCLSIKKGELDDYIDESMPERMFSLSTEYLDNPREAEIREQAQREIKELTKYLEDFVKDAVKQRLSAQRVADVEREVQGQIRDLEAKTKLTHIPQVVHDLIENPSLWTTGSIEEKRVLLRATVAITVLPVGRVGRYGAPPVAARVQVQTLATMGAMADETGESEMFMVTGFGPV